MVLYGYASTCNLFGSTIKGKSVIGKQDNTLGALVFKKGESQAKPRLSRAAIRLDIPQKASGQDADGYARLDNGFWEAASLQPQDEKNVVFPYEKFRN